jgi:HSP20 family protein
MWRNTLPWLNTFDELRREMDRLFDGFGVRHVGFPVRRGPFPALNVWDNAESVFVEAEVPGVKPDDFEVYAIGNELTIKGRRHPVRGDKLVYQRQERGTGEFTRVITLPCEVNADKVDAVLKDGVLRIELPKAAAARPKQIAVKTS